MVILDVSNPLSSLLILDASANTKEILKNEILCKRHPRGTHSFLLSLILLRESRFGVATAQCKTVKVKKGKNRLGKKNCRLYALYVQFADVMLG